MKTLDQLEKEYEANGSNCCGAKIIGEDICADCKEHCQSFSDYCESCADYAEAS